MWVKKEFNGFYDLKENSWGGALDTLQDIENADLEEEFMQHLEDTFFDNENDTPTETELNDYIWNERDIIYSSLGLNENGELEEEEEEEKEFLTFEKALEFVESLKNSQGFYSRLYAEMKEFTEEQKMEFETEMEMNEIYDTMDLIMFLEN